MVEDLNHALLIELSSKRSSRNDLVGFSEDNGLLEQGEAYLVPVRVVIDVAAFLTLDEMPTTGKGCLMRVLHYHLNVLDSAVVVCPVVARKGWKSYLPVLSPAVRCTQLLAQNAPV